LRQTNSKFTIAADNQVSLLRSVCTMKIMTRLWLVALLGLCACGGQDPDEGRKVEATGQVATGLDALPAEALAVARAAMPEMKFTAAEQETRDGNEYYEVGGTLPDGSEWELDMTMVDGVWTVVETRRDIGMDLVPEGVSNTLDTKFPGWRPDRIIESNQGAGVVVYEFFGKTDKGEKTKVEVRWEDRHAELLLDEGLH